MGRPGTQVIPHTPVETKIRFRRAQTPLLCGRRDLNPHTRRHQDLNLTCLPIPPLPRGEQSNPRRNLQLRSQPADFATVAAGLGGQAEMSRSRISLATWPVARTLENTCSMTPVGEMTKVDRITPVTTLP